MARRQITNRLILNEVEYISQAGRDVVTATIFPIFNDVNSGIYEVGSGEARTFEDVLNIMNVKYTYRKRSDIPKGYQFFTKANKNEFMDGWEPIYNLEKGLEEYKEYLES